ncbi:hypothetical protein MTR67_040521 [Solanum verrucosum]|uniref:Exonuclease domain-containing protein n=1 Tax=Solanum verrucosum TaxID=315347 RepID=A0AAF0UKC8_SOLVR|nr:hypothetical protein MTR67_040521 [Solanum verrucosum]
MLVDKDEKIIFHTYVLPQTPVVDYRYEITGITEETLQDTMPLNEVRERIQQILYSVEPLRRVLVGHNLEKHLHCLKISYPDRLLRYDIQVGFHDPYQDAVSAMRLYKRMCSQDHPMVWVSISPSQLIIGCSNPWKSVAHERMTIEELLAISRANYQCWCLDSQD